MNKLLISKQLSSLRKTDSCNTISTIKSTENAPNSTQNVHHIIIDEVFTNLEKSNAKKQYALNPIKMLKNISHQSVLVVDTPHNVNVITDTFPRLSHKDVPSVLVWKKVAHIVSNSESNNEIESLGSSLTDDKKILEYLLNLPCLACNKNRKKRHTKNGRKEKEERKGKKEKGEKKREKKPLTLCVKECFTIRIS